MMTMHPQTPDILPRVAFVATGGTIAGTMTEDSKTSWAYSSAQRSGESLVMGIPGLLRRAQWHFEQPYSIGSQNLELGHMLQLRAVLLRLLESPEIDSIIVTHGTDTMEDMLYFLHLTVPSHALGKPVLFTGSMLPSDHEQADGPGNISGAFEFLIQCLSTNADVSGHSAMPFGLCMQGLFTPAHRVEKQSTAGLDAFDGPYSVLANTQWLLSRNALEMSEDSGVQGQFASLFDPTATRHPLFEAMEVPVVFCTPGNGPLRQLTDLLNRKPASVVVAAPGHGNIPEACVPVLRRLLLNGVSVVRASRVIAGGVEQGGEFDALDAFRQAPVQGGNAVFSEAGGLNLSKCVMYERLRVLAHSLSV
ncbi:asparaginase domain-containing protein [Limnobacter sp.]|uniref:asparaginase domain-containing protein n=1 Tax=Limnobacter sp. TaxID=2003368 RepID=UPI002FDF2AA8